MSPQESWLDTRLFPREAMKQRSQTSITLSRLHINMFEIEFWAQFFQLGSSLLIQNLASTFHGESEMKITLSADS